MSKARRKFLRQIFDGFDEDGGGDIDFEEFQKAISFADPKSTLIQNMTLFKGNADFLFLITYCNFEAISHTHSHFVYSYLWSL